ncbi:MAG TPA: lysine 5,6-aminomutase subunit alpha, partial [Bacillota bacterium]|nr:lysine 5,6-aminomutase subunit alpha [Bacillota bacterium]
MEKKLNLDQAKIDGARRAAGKIADQLHSWISSYTTTTIERAVARLMGVDGVDSSGVPLPNVLVDKLHQAGLLEYGLAPWLARAVIATGKTVQEIAEAVGSGALE